MARDDADVGRVALVAAAPQGELHERHGLARVGGQRALRGRHAAPARPEVAAAAASPVTSSRASVTVGVTCSFDMRKASGRTSGDTDGRPPPAPVVPGDHEVPAGAISRRTARARAGRHGRRRRASSLRASARARACGPYADSAPSTSTCVARKSAKPLSRSSRRARSRMRRAGALRLGDGVDADDDERARRAKAVHARSPRPCRHRSAAGRARRSTRTRCSPSCSISHLAEVADHVGQHVGARIADLVQQLLGDGGAARPGRRCPPAW